MLIIIEDAANHPRSIVITIVIWTVIRTLKYIKYLSCVFSLNIESHGTKVPPFGSNMYCIWIWNGNYFTANNYITLIMSTS